MPRSKCRIRAARGRDDHRGLHGRYRYDIVERLDVIGVGSLTVVLLTGFFTGAALTAQSGLTLDMYGARSVVGRLVSASMIKELGPVLTALMLTGRIGSGIAAELGSMVVTDQINALRALGTDPIRKLVVPRVLAGFLMAPVSPSFRRGRDFRRWMVASPAAGAERRTGRQVAEALYMRTSGGLIKPFVFGFIIADLRAMSGRTKGGTQGVGEATTVAVVTGSVAVIAVDFFVTKILIATMY